MSSTEMCCRCYDEGPLFEANCFEKPERLMYLPVGMYHCPDCGAMILAGIPHPPLCLECFNRQKKGFDL